MPMTNRYILTDSVGKFVKSFPTFIQASNYKLACGNNGWTIKYQAV